MSKVIVFGIDGMPPELVFEKWKGALPNFSYLMHHGVYGKIAATIPPTSIASWTSMFSGMDPGTTGIYGYTPKLKPPDYQFRLVQSGDVRVRRIWDLLGDYGKSSIIFNVPMTFPVQPLKGYMVSDFMTPGFDTNCMYPESLKQEVKNLLGGTYIFDISEFAAFRNMPVGDIIRRVNALTDERFRVIEYLMKHKEWDLLAFVIDGSDRLNHTLWRYQDETHKRYEYHTEFSHALKNYYLSLDKKLGEFIEFVKNNKETTLIVTSDHGINPMKGRINLNDWFLKNHLLTLNDDYAKESENGPIKLNLARLNWKETICYAQGAYEGFVYINKKKDASDYNTICTYLIEQIKSIPGEDGERLNTNVYKVRDLYPDADADAPDLIVYFDNLFWGTNSDVGNKGFYSWANLVGPDDSLHSTHGTFLMYGKEVKQKGEIQDVRVRDIALTIAKLLEPRILKNNTFHGQIIHGIK